MPPPLGGVEEEPLPLPGGVFFAVEVLPGVAVDVVLVADGLLAPGVAELDAAGLSAGELEAEALPEAPEAGSAREGSVLEDTALEVTVSAGAVEREVGEVDDAWPWPPPLPRRRERPFLVEPLVCCELDGCEVAGLADVLLSSVPEVGGVEADAAVSSGLTLS
ncbi:hypothetical protein [Vreelandella populi]|uniref:hypothetical protein n=1 Tax=Vreelandella populi TaxID=2498858 RepID=UPI001C8D09B1|nr:hypothetical protein [Halomonas populi]